MALSEELQREYEAVLQRAILRHGTVTNLPGTGRWGWQDYDATSHLAQCGGLSERQVLEDEWSEWGGTDAGPNYKHGMSLTGVSCQCGRLADRKVRWDDYPTNMTEAVFEEAFGRR